MSETSDKYVSVFIPTYNGEQYLEECIKAVLTQKLPPGFKLELLITDSGSSDRTLEILNQFMNDIVFDEIPNSEYGHGKTRQRAAMRARGEFILFLSQDATPANDRWLINMIEPFFLSTRIGCVYGRQRPRPNAAATIKREVAGVFGALGNPDTIVVTRWRSLVDNITEYAHNDFFSDVNSAVRRSLLIGDVPFRDVAYSEDQALAQDMQEKGYLKAYSPNGVVWHSNEYTWKQYFYRKFDEFTGLQQGTGYSISISMRSLMLGWIRPTIHDLKFIKYDGEYSLQSKLVWAVRSPLYNIASKAGQYTASKYARDTKKGQNFSLEKRAKSKDH